MGKKDFTNHAPTIPNWCIKLQTPYDTRNRKEI